MDVAPNHPNHSQRVLRRPETSVSGDSESTFFLGLTTGSDKAGVFFLHGRIPIFPEDYTGCPEDISVCCVDVAPRPPKATPQVLNGWGSCHFRCCPQLPEASTYVLRGQLAPARVTQRPIFQKPPHMF